MKGLKYIVFILCCFISLRCYAQIDAENQDKPFTTPEDTMQSVVVQRHSPKKAAWMSALMPGAGQVYNKKYWKLPIVYGGLAGLGTWVGVNAKNYKGYTTAYRTYVDDDPNNNNGSYKGYYTKDQLGLKRDQTKRNLDLSIILLSVGYAFQIVDAVVDAHLFEYSITDDLSVRLQPDVRTYQAMGKMQASVGVNFSLQFKK